MSLSLDAFAGSVVSRETYDRLERFDQVLRTANAHQNLVSDSTLEQLWTRHFADSAQLLRYQPHAEASWADIGSGAGLPGLVIACLSNGPVTLVEPRRLRADFLRLAIDELGLNPRVAVQASKAQNLSASFDVITARAVAPLHAILRMTNHLSRPGTVWVLPKGRSAKSELAEAKRNWHCDARIERSMTDPDSGIVVLHNVQSKDSR